MGEDQALALGEVEAFANFALRVLVTNAKLRWLNSKFRQHLARVAQNMLVLLAA